MDKCPIILYLYSMDETKKIEIKAQLLKVFAPYFDTPNELLDYCDKVLFNWVGLSQTKST